MTLLIIMVVFIGLMYVLMVLPQKRKMDQQKKLLNAIEPGARVLLNTGMFGTVRATGERQMVVELAPGVEVTVLKQAVMKATSPDEEEFEYSDSGATPAVGAGDVVDAYTADGEQSWQLSPQAVQADDDQVGDDAETPAFQAPQASGTEAPEAEPVDADARDSQADEAPVPPDGVAAASSSPDAAIVTSDSERTGAAEDVTVHPGLAPGASRPEGGSDTRPAH